MRQADHLRNQCFQRRRHRGDHHTRSLRIDHDPPVAEPTADPVASTTGSHATCNASAQKVTSLPSWRSPSLSSPRRPCAAASSSVPRYFTWIAVPSWMIT